MPSVKTINKQTELDVNIQLAKLAYRLLLKEIHGDQSTEENQQHMATQSSSSPTIEQTVLQTEPEIKFQHLEFSLQHLKHEVKKVINKRK